MKAVLVVSVLCLQAWVILASTSAPDTNTCSTSGCTCEDAGDGSRGVSKQEGLAAAIGAMAPLVVGGAGFGVYRLLRGAGSSLPSGPDAPSNMSSPRLGGKRGSLAPSFKDSPPPYHGARRGSTPVSLFGEDDELSFEDSPRPDTSSTYTNIHRPSKEDAVNRWM